ncbi:hypothetical protein [Pararhodobacter sp. SW119]|uniref:hypothetical protein n=1 Tax=Pararhodobacter sp. SW119 TaxID=2780075 RepID=UPI001ADF225A|nr:hypothetical protein [Pararhodobacter sp. SW119]
MESNLREALSGNILIKHCVELVPDAVNSALTDVSCANGYRHLFLIRRSPLDRLLSLHFAKSFNIWGPDHSKFASEAEISRRLAGSQIPVESLLNQERDDRERLSTVYNSLLAHGIMPTIAVFEDLYNRTDCNVARALFARVSASLGLAAEEDQQVVDTILFGGSQRTRDQYRDFRNHEDFEREVSKLGPFQLGSSPGKLARDALQLPEGSVASLFALRRSWRSDLVRIEGVGVDPADPDADWRVSDSNSSYETFTGLRSENFQANNSALPNAANARFAAIDVPEASLGEVSVRLGRFE